MENLDEPWRTFVNLSERQRTPQNSKNFESILEHILVQIRSHPKLLEPLRNLGEASNTFENLIVLNGISQNLLGWISTSRNSGVFFAEPYWSQENVTAPYRPNMDQLQKLFFGTFEDPLAPYETFSELFKTFHNLIDPYRSF